MKLEVMVISNWHDGDWWTQRWGKKGYKIDSEMTNILM